MNYTTQDLIQFQAILDAFRYYTDSSPFFDILFTPKRGYIFLIIEKDFLEASGIETPEAMFERFMFEITSDVRDLFICGEHIDVDLYPAEIQESRRRIFEYICHLPAHMQEHYTEQMESYFESYNK